MIFASGQHVTYLGHDKTVIRVSPDEPAVLCQDGHPAKWGGSTAWYYTDDLKTPCEDCGGSGEKILNPDWPDGDAPYSERCSTCGGSGSAPE